MLIRTLGVEFDSIGRFSKYMKSILTIYFGDLGLRIVTMRLTDNSNNHTCRLLN